MMTNTYIPYVGGVATSVKSSVDALRSQGHRVLVVAPDYDEAKEDEHNVVRVAAIQHFNGSDFAVALPVSPDLSAILDDFRPDILHSHYPFLIGDLGLRVAASRHLPLVFTHHTRYEDCTEYVPLQFEGIKRFVVELTTGYANLCHRVIAPGLSIAALLEERGVETPINVVPTGVKLEKFSSGDRDRARGQHGIPADAFVVGYVGRLAPEKNLKFLGRSVQRFLKLEENSYFLVVGEGPSADELQDIFDADVSSKVIFAGTLKNQDLIDVYAAFDVFAFASRSETQGVVLAEALAAGCPVVALNAPGVRQIVAQRANGMLVDEESPEIFSNALRWVAGLTSDETAQMRRRARHSAEPYSLEEFVNQLLEVYGMTMDDNPGLVNLTGRDWEGLLKVMDREWRLWVNRLRAVARAATPRSFDE